MVRETGSRLVIAIQKQTEKITYFCTAENLSPNLAVHEIRKCLKRIRALLRFYLATSGDFAPGYINQFQLLGKRLSPIRESFMNIQIFEKFASGNTIVQERKIKQAREIFQEKNRLLTENLAKEDEFKSIQKLVRGFEFRLNDKVSERPSVKHIYTELCNSYVTGFNLYNQPEPVTDGNQLHKLRKKLKRLWYQLEFARYMHLRYFRLKADQLNKITELLGDDHDLFVFLRELKSGDFDFKYDEIVTLGNFVEHQRELNRIKLNPRLKQLFNEYPEDFNQKMKKIFKTN